MCVQGSQKCPGLKNLLRRTMVRRSTTPTRPMESHAAQSDVATTWDSISVRCGIKRGEGKVPQKIAPRGEIAVSTAVRGSPGGRNTRVRPGLFQRPRNSIRGVGFIAKTAS